MSPPLILILNSNKKFGNSGQSYLMGDQDLWMLKAALDQKGGLVQKEVAENEPTHRAPPTIFGTPSNRRGHVTKVTDWGWPMRYESDLKQTFHGQVLESVPLCAMRVGDNIGMAAWFRRH
jgi:hypothetical protein